MLSWGSDMSVIMVVATIQAPWLNINDAHMAHIGV